MSLRARKKAETLSAILDAARSLFAERGYDDTRTRDIADRAGIATGTLFNYAATKEAVVVLLWRDLASRAVADGTASAAAIDQPIDAMVALFRPIFTFYAADRALGRVFLTQVMFDDGTDPASRALNEGFIGQIALQLQPFAGSECLPAALSVFSAYYTTLTMLLAGRLADVDSALVLFRDLVRTQSRGWRAP
jgi:TetR/AcrR family transcriptional regulator, cholesterol catabolism regulator